MARYHYLETVRVEAPAEEVFALLADGAGWQRWARPLVPGSRWEREGTPAPGGVGAIRRLGTGPVASREEIVAYDPPRSLSYTVLSGFPAADYLATVRLEEVGGGTRVEWEGRFDPVWPGTGRLVLAFTRRYIRALARRLARAAERGASFTTG